MFHLEHIEIQWQRIDPTKGLHSFRATFLWFVFSPGALKIYDVAILVDQTLLSFFLFAKPQEDSHLDIKALRGPMQPSGRRRFFSLSLDTTVWEIDRSRIYSHELTDNLSWSSVDAAIDRPAGKRLRHRATSSRRWLQFAKSNFRPFETVRRSAARVPPIGLRIARDATHRGAISDSIVVTGPRSTHGRFVAAWCRE